MIDIPSTAYIPRVSELVLRLRTFRFLVHVQGYPAEELRRLALEHVVLHRAYARSHRVARKRIFLTHSFHIGLL